MPATQPTVDAVPHPAGTAISAEDHFFYQEQGYLILRGFFDQERIALALADAEAARQRADLVHIDNIRCRWQDNVQTGECTFDAFDPVFDLSPACADLGTDSRLMEVMSALYGEPARLFKDKLIYKPPAAKGYGLHQDYISWPTFPKSFVTVLIPLDPCNAENGCTEVFAGYHREGCLSPLDGEYHELKPEGFDPSRLVKMELDAGDIAVFSGMAPHRSAANQSDRWRRQLYVSYNADSDGGEQRAAHYREFHGWLVRKYAEYGKTGVYFR